ncbi:hypothetical protein [Varibaculum cambriense]|uniref:hypothetical protein n=1 Tax=Varibaculum cambriense TaxID=184870 RepID=UPI0029098E03|nr:hypothetical protein [Varibaculum cambriense]MDU5541486.1 hypothetical protein [Varibaculum cambriense]
MALFELESGRLIPAQFGTPVGHGLEMDVLESIRSQVLEVIDRPLFPVAWAGDSGESGTGPHSLTALDASGQVVSVEVLSRLDPVSLVAAISRLGQVSGQGWMDLASQYPGGVQAFQTGWAEFREAMPPTTQPGPRLFLVVGEIDEGCYSALGVLFASGIEIHQISARQMSNGRRFLEVSQVTSSSINYSRPQIGGHRAPAPQISWHVDEESAPQEEQVSPVPPAPPAPPAATEVSEEVPTGDPEVEAIEGEESVENVGNVEPQEDNPQEEASVEAEVSAGEDGGVAPEALAETAKEADAAASSTPQLLQKDAAGLRSISSLVGQDAVLLWSDDRGRICEALLKEEGVIDPGDGQLTDQVQAVFEQVGGNSELDAWEAFRIGNLEGPTLAEAIAEVNAEIERHAASRERKHGH